MNRPKPSSPVQTPLSPAIWPDLPTKPGIYVKHLPDGREVPWIVLSKPNDNAESSANHIARGCCKCTN